MTEEECQMDGEPVVYLNFTRNCAECGGTVVYRNGQQEPHQCEDRAIDASEGRSDG